MEWIIEVIDGKGKVKHYPFNNSKAILGRSETIEIPLDHHHISKEHASLQIIEGKCVISDLGSTNGTYVNGIRLVKPQVLKEKDTIVIGNYTILVRKEDLSKRSSNKDQPPGAPKRKEKKSYDEILQLIHGRLLRYLDLRRLNLDQISEEELRNKTSEATSEIIRQLRSERIISGIYTDDQILEDILNEALGLGPLEEFLADDSISEIMVNHAKQIYVEKDGKIELSLKQFSSDSAVLGVIERIVAPIGRRIDESSPMVDARLKDGSRINAIIPPLAIKGPSLTIRKFSKKLISSDMLVTWNSLNQQMSNFIKMCVLSKKNIIIVGGTGSGKTTTLNVLSSFIPIDERIVTIEDAAELQLQQPHVVSLESRPPNIEGKGAVKIRDLVKNSLRMRPDRLVIGECRGGEALDMLQAMNTGHDGSMTTVHANSPRDALSRLETMCLMSGMDLPIKAIREQVGSAVQILVHQQRLSCGQRKVTSITEVTGTEGEVITMQSIFEFKQQGYDEKGKTIGNFVATGYIPKFYDDLRRKGLEVDLSIFRTDDF